MRVDALRAVGLRLMLKMRMQWLNAILKEMWPFYDYAVCEMLKARHCNHLRGLELRCEREMCRPAHMPSSVQPLRSDGWLAAPTLNVAAVCFL
jgi:hypothetical protein